MKIGIASDHHGIILKQELTIFLKEKGYNVIDYGPNDSNNVDYCDYAFKVSEAVRDKNISYGILICNTGIGMSIAANKVKNVRCAKVENEEEARLTRQHNDANVIAISSMIQTDLAKKMVELFLITPFLNEERHQRRVEKIKKYES